MGPAAVGTLTQVNVGLMASGAVISAPKFVDLTQIKEPQVWIA